jgi:uncharacterized ion transporter superfamily protein YfcC
MVRLKGRETWMIPFLMALFALGGTTYGMAEETLAFYVLLIPVMIAAKYDALTAVAVILLGAGVGVLGSTINAFSTVIASDAAGVTFADGLALRLIILALSFAVTVAFVMRYAARVKADPTKSLVFDKQAANEAHFLSETPAEAAAFTGLHKVVLILFALTFGVMIWGVSVGGWWMAEMSGLFLAAAIVIGRCPRSAGRGADHRSGARHRRGDGRRPHHRHNPERGRRQRGGSHTHRLHPCDLLDRGGDVLFRALHLGVGGPVDADPCPRGRFRRGQA